MVSALTCAPIAWSFLDVTLAGCRPLSGIDSRVEEGVMDLSYRDLQKEGNIKLDGNWEFYWDQLIQPGSFFQLDKYLTGYYPLPLYWTKYTDLNLPAKGFATYRIRINVDETYKSLSIKTPEIYTEYRLWINGEIIDSYGSFDFKPA